MNTRQYFFIVLTLLQLIVLQSYSQIAKTEKPWGIEKQRTIGGSDDEIITTILPATDGEFIIAGSSRSPISGEKTVNSNGLMDFWLVGMDSMWNILWQRSYGGSSYDNLNSIIRTSDGGFLLGGTSLSNISGDKSEICRGNTDYWILKIDSARNKVWDRTYGGNNTDNLKAFYETADHGYMLLGSSYSFISGDKTDYVGSHDLWVIRIDSLGNIVWQNAIGGSGADILYQPQTTLQTPDGSYIIVLGSGSDSSFDKSDNCYGSSDYWIVKIDSSGNVLKENTLGGEGGDAPSRIFLTPDDGLLIFGYSNSHASFDKSEDCIGESEDIWILKTDSNYQKQWDETIGGSDFEIWPTVLPYQNGYLIATQTGSNLSGDKTENLIGSWGSPDMWVMQIDSMGKILWQNSFGGLSNEEPVVFYLASDSSVYLGGKSQSDITGDKTEICRGGIDYWLLKISNTFNSITGTLIDDLNSNGQRDSLEYIIPHKKIVESNSGGFTYSQIDGTYELIMSDSGSFSVSPLPISYRNAIPSNYSDNFPNYLMTDSLNDFAFQPTGNISDLCALFTPVGVFRPGSNALYVAAITNQGTTSQSPTLIFFPDSGVSFVSAIPAATSITPDSVVWDLNPIDPLQTTVVNIQVMVSTLVVNGFVVNSGVRLEPLADANPSCNYSNHEVEVIGSWDPNNIIVDEDTIFTTDFPNPPYLDYIINFQNTGNDTAFFVKVLNPIDTSFLDLSTFEFLDATSGVNIQWLPWERNMEFRFDNILLPDSNVDEPGSHGFVHYRIQPRSNLVANNKIINFAGIYFDYNPQVLTNEDSTLIVLPTSNHSMQMDDASLVVYPNPAGDYVIVESAIVNDIPSIRLLSVEGRILNVPFVALSSYRTSVDISPLSKGIYILEISSPRGVSRGKVVKD